MDIEIEQKLEAEVVALFGVREVLVSLFWASQVKFLLNAKLNELGLCAGVPARA